MRCILTAARWLRAWPSRRRCRRPPARRQLPRVLGGSRSAASRRIEGFGGAFTEAAAVTWQELSRCGAEALLRDYFDPEHGHGYTLCRVHMNSCDFALGNYAHVETAGRPGAARLSASSATARRCCPSSRPRCAWPAGRIKLLASPWSPPAVDEEQRPDESRRPACAPNAAPPGRSATCASSRPTPPRACRSGACRCRTNPMASSAGTRASTAPRRNATSCATISARRWPPPAWATCRSSSGTTTATRWSSAPASSTADPEAASYRLGHRLPLVRRRPLRPRAAAARRLARQAAAVHRGLPGRRPAHRFVGAGRALCAFDDQRPQPLDGGLDRLEPAARRAAAAPTTSATSAARRCWPTRARATLLPQSSYCVHRPLRPLHPARARGACCARRRSRRWSARPSSTTTIRWPWSCSTAARPRCPSCSRRPMSTGVSSCRRARSRRCGTERRAWRSTWTRPP